MTISRRSRKLIFFAAVPIAVVLILGTSVLVVVNRVVVPRIVSRAEHAITAVCDCTLRVARARYVPLRGIVLRGVVLEGAGNSQAVTRESTGEQSPAASGVLRVEVARLRARVSPAAVRHLDDLTGFSVPEISPQNVADVFLSALETVAATRLLPKTLIADDISISVPAAKGFSIAIAMDQLRMAHDESDATVSITSDNDSDESPAVDVQIEYGRRSISGWVAVGRIPLALPPVSSGELGGRLSFRLVEPNSVVLAGEIDFQNTSVDIPAISDETIRDLNVRYVFTATLNPEPLPAAPDERRRASSPAEFPTGELVFQTGDLYVNKVRLSVVPALSGLFAGPGHFQLEIHLPETPVHQILGSIPGAISGDLARTEVAGSLAWDLDLRVPLDSISDMEWTADTVLSELAVTGIHPAVNVYKLNDEFVHTIRDRNIGYVRPIRIPAAREASMEWMLLHSEHTARQIERTRTQAAVQLAVRPPVAELHEPVRQPPDDTPVASPYTEPDSEYRYVYVDDMSPWVTRAILTAEDGDFFFYGGLNPVTLADAIELNVEAGEVLFGASTISMQLAKMLFLGQERVFSRKIQELCLVYLMEHEVPVSKERILELYINLAEFGPGIFGISDASLHYFAKHPRNLTAGEATWLASILPAPKSYYQQFEDGRISDAGFARMVHLYNIMLERGRMTRAEYDEAVRRRPAFCSTNVGEIGGIAYRDIGFRCIMEEEITWSREV